MIVKLRPQTLPELLFTRAENEDDAARISFLDADGVESNSFSYGQLFDDASIYGRRLVAAGLTDSDVVLASFPDHESHIRLFWACCLAGIPFCPLPTLHPDPGRQTILFNHLQTLFHKPTLVGPSDVLQSVLSLVPDLKTLDPTSLKAEAEPSCIFPKRRFSPKDTVCFMLTSGSTGNSKAVLLTHSTLLSSVRGKIRHHGSTFASRFFNWIAFDHVACLSEIHIHALEANAE
jgi:acyl-CoA synthetase (AMP-forming)/AMP-acid ligase II